MPSLNEYFAENMTGKEIAFSVQPYRNGKGTITEVKPRIVKTREFTMPRGTCNVEYEVFDLTVTVSEGSEIGAFWGGVPVSKPRDLAGQKTTLSGVTYGELSRAVKDKQPIIIAVCG